MKVSPLGLALALVSALSSLACNTGEGQMGVAGGGTAGEAFGDFLLTDAIAEELFSFEVRVAELRLESTDGSVTENLLAAPIALDLLGLVRRPDWVAATAFPADSYERVILRLAPDGFRASDLAGAAIDVVPAGLEVAADLVGGTRIVERGEYVRFLVDVDLEASLSGDPAAGMVAFDPVATTMADDGAVPLPVDELDAMVLARNTGSLALSVEGFADGDHLRSLGTFDITVLPETTLVDPRGTLFTQTAFFYTLLVPGLTAIEVHGSLGARGSFLADRIEIESQDGRPGGLFPIKLEGTLVERGAGGLLQVRVRGVSRGAELFDPILAAQPDPGTIVVAPDARTLAFDGAGLLSPADLPLGGELELKLELGAGSPFAARRIGLDGVDPRFAREATTGSAPGNDAARPGLPASRTRP